MGGEVDEKRELLRHFIAALAYRTQKALRGAPSEFGPDPLPSLAEEVARFHEMLDDLSLHLRDGTPLLQGMSAERLLQGPFSDAMTHAGQLAILRRLAGAPVAPENFIVADIVADRCGPRQADPVSADGVWPEAPPGWVPPSKR